MAIDLLVTLYGGPAMTCTHLRQTLAVLVSSIVCSKWSCTVISCRILYTSILRRLPLRRLWLFLPTEFETWLTLNDIPVRTSCCSCHCCLLLRTTPTLVPAAPAGIPPWLANQPSRKKPAQTKTASFGLRYVMV